MTIKDVAKYSGVSISTVSRVLNNQPNVRANVRAKVMQAVQELHYVPNVSAQDLVRPQADTIGVVLRGAENPFLMSVLHSIEQAVSATGYTMILNQIGTDEDEIAKGANLIRSKRLRGLIFLGGSFDYTPERIAALNVPFVCCTYTECFGNLSKDAYSSVSIDDYAEAYKAVNLLIARGHKKIAVLLGAVDDHSISELRYKGYCDALKDANIPLDRDLVAECGSFEMEAVYRKTLQLLGRKSDFTALFTVSDLMSIAAIKALHDVGKKVPEDCSILSIDGIEMTKYTVPTLAALVQPGDTMGKESVRILMDVLEGCGKNRHLRLDTTLREGETLSARK